MGKIITLTKESNEIQRVVTLKNNRNKRHKYREFVIEGHAAIDEACAMGWKIQSFFYNKDIELSRWAKNHLANTQYETAYAISDHLMGKISDKSDTSELAAIVETKVQRFSSYQPRHGDVVVVLDEPKSPGNIGMMIRSAVAFGASALVISGHGADEYDPKCIRASVGTFFSLPIYRVEGIGNFSNTIEALKQESEVRIIASGDKGSASIEEVAFNSDILFLVLGNETSGISTGYKQIADQFARLPLQGRFTSLNVAAAGSIFLYEIFRHRTPKTD